MFTALAYVHGQLLRGCWWLLKLPFKTLWAALLSVLALLGEEFRRWAGLAVAGLLIVGAGKATLQFAPAAAKQPLVLTVLALLVIWALAVKRAAHLTKENNLVKVRQRQAFRELKGDVQRLRVGQRIIDGTARATQGTPIGGIFKTNREQDAQAEAQTRAAEAKAQRVAEEAESEAERLDAMAPGPY